MLEKMTWQADRMILDGLVFRLEPFRSENWELGENCFRFVKNKELTEDYERFWSTRKDFRPENVFEIGIHDGGSTALWFERFHPRKLVAIDLETRGDSDYFKQYISSRGLGDRISTYWGTNQADADRLREIASGEFSDPLDLVIDDASHFYMPTKVSFETLFPLLRPGGLYIIEDWAWAHWESFQTPDHPWPREAELTRLIVELVETAGSWEAMRPRLIPSMSISHVFAVVERGEFGSDPLSGFKLESFISRRPRPPEALAESSPTSGLSRRHGQPPGAFAGPTGFRRILARILGRGTA